MLELILGITYIAEWATSYQAHAERSCTDEMRLSAIQELSQKMFGASFGSTKNELRNNALTKSAEWSPLH